MKRPDKRRAPFGSELPDNAVRYVLEALIPYSQANLKLVFKPSAFFDDLERIDTAQYKRQTLRNAYYQAIKRSLIEVDKGQLRVTESGKRSLQPYKPEMLKNSHILVVFDIPETERNKRRMFRVLLRELKFRQIQQSVWASKYECRDILASEISVLKITPYVQIYEATEMRL